MSNDLTNELFWETYWKTLKLPIGVDWGFKNDRVIGQEILDTVPQKPGLSVLEIGCAPGKWLSFLSKELKASKVSGIEYVESAANKTIENLKLQNISNFEIIKGDFFTHNFTETYDVVLSLGFIEHFEDYEKVLLQQLDLVSKDGYLIMGIPRFIGVNYLMQKNLDKQISNKLIPGHNLKTMHLENFDTFAKKYNLTIVSNKYIGGYERGLFPVGEVESKPGRIFFKIINKALGIILGNINSNLTSSYQIAVFKK